jgi:hypothetical protein
MASLAPSPPRLALLEMLSAPPSRFVPPLKVFVPERVSLPLPSLVRKPPPPVPMIVPA